LQGVASSCYDVVVLGGTLGLLLATALLAQRRQHQHSQGLRVAVIERGKLQGRQQEWNITYSDLQVVVQRGDAPH
jgi:lycopene cyclase CruP